MDHGSINGSRLCEDGVNCGCRWEIQMWLGLIVGLWFSWQGIYSVIFATYQIAQCNLHLIGSTNPRHFGEVSLMGIPFRIED